MAQEVNPSGERIYDPNLGEERDAFPGEVIPEEQEKTLNRLMREDKEAFRNQFEPVIKTGQLNEEEINAIEKAANIRAEIKRNEYLDSIRQNPANILQSILKEFNPKENPIVDGALFTLNRNVNGILNTIESQKTSDQLKGETKDTFSYLNQEIRGSEGLRPLIFFASRDNEGRTIDMRVNDQKVIFPLFKRLGFLPSEEIKSFDNLFAAVRGANNNQDSGRPYISNDRYSNENILRGLESKNPGLEGAQARISLDFISQLKIIEILGTAELFTRIVDKGGFTPYQQDT